MNQSQKNYICRRVLEERLKKEEKIRKEIPTYNEIFSRHKPRLLKKLKIRSNLKKVLYDAIELSWGHWKITETVRSVSIGNNLTIPLAVAFINLDEETSVAIGEEVMGLCKEISDAFEGRLDNIKNESEALMDKAQLGDQEEAYRMLEDFIKKEF